jgi:hypothetical protein
MSLFCPIGFARRGISINPVAFIPFIHNTIYMKPFPKPPDSDNKMLDHPQGSQAEDGTE